MHNVSNAWKTNQNSQLRKKTDIKAYLFNGAKPDWARKIGALDFIYCKEAMSFSLVGTTNTIDFGFDTPIDITFGGQKGVKFDISPIYINTTSHYSTQITLKDSSNNVIASFNLATIFRNPTTYQNVSQIEFKVIGNEAGAIARAKCRYFSITKPIELDSGDIESLEYKAHADVLNKDLPYHKIVVKTIEKPIPLSVMCAYFTIGYKGINNGNDEFIPLGCGYYYLDTAGYDEFKQQYTFKDTLKDLINPYVYKSYLGVNDLRSYASAGLYNPTNILYPVKKQNYDVSMISQTSSQYIPIDKTIAEVLQMIGQADCKTLFVDNSNIITYKDFRLSAPNIDDNPFWLLEKPVVAQSEKARNLLMTAYSWQIKYFNSAQVKETFATFTATQTGDASFRFEKGYYSATINGYAFTTNNVNYFETSVGSGITYNLEALGEYYESAIESQNKTISQNGDTDYTLDIHFLKDVNFNDMFDYYTYWLGLWHNLNLNVRLDPKYTILDKIKSDKYGTFIIEDIEATYNGGYSGAIKGRIITPKIKAPILKSKTITSSTSYSFEIYNPNTDYDVDLLVAYNGGTLSFTISPLETITLDYSNASQLSTDVANWLVENLSSDVNAYFEYEDDYGNVVDSDNITLLKANVPQAPVLSNLVVNDENDFSFKITNPNSLQMTLKFHTSSGELTETYEMQPNETIEFNQDNLPIYDSVYNWLNNALTDDVYCWLEEQYLQIITDNTIILQENA